MPVDATIDATTDATVQAVAAATDPGGLGRLDETGRLEAGLDALDTPAHPGRRRLGRRRRLRRAVRAIAPPVVTTVVLVLAWQIVASTGRQPASVLPAPGAVWSAFVQRLGSGDLAQAVGGSLGRGAIGFLVSVAAGTALGLLLSQLRLVRDGVGPLLSGMQSLPSVAWVPAALLWFGSGDGAVYTVVVLGAVPSIANGLLAGVDQVPPSYDRVAAVLGASRTAAVRLVTLPAALPGYLAGLRQGWAFSWRALMAAELIGASTERGPGLGGLLDGARRSADMPLVLAAILLILVVGITVEVALFRPVERRVLHARGLAR